MGDTIVDLLRHGEAEGGARIRGSSNDPLTPRGQQQMQDALGEQRPWQQIITSPLQRCATFAQWVGEDAGIGCMIEASFQEIDLGDWEGERLEALITNHPKDASAFLTNPFSYQPPGAERVEDFCERVMAGWESVVEAYEGKHLLLVTHGGPIRVILGEVLGMPRDALVRIEVPHACLTRIRIPADHWPSSLMFHGRGL